MVKSKSLMKLGAGILLYGVGGVSLWIFLTSIESPVIQKSPVGQVSQKGKATYGGKSYEERMTKWTGEIHQYTSTGGQTSQRDGY